MHKITRFSIKFNHFCYFSINVILRYLRGSSVTSKYLWFLLATSQTLLIRLSFVAYFQNAEVHLEVSENIDVKGFSSKFRDVLNSNYAYQVKKEKREETSSKPVEVESLGERLRICIPVNSRIGEPLPKQFSKQGTCSRLLILAYNGQSRYFLPSVGKLSLLIFFSP